MEPSWLPTLSSFAEITSQSFWSPALLFALAAANLLALSLAAYLIYSHFLRRRRLRYRKICTLEISNLGNIPARYALRFTQEVKTVKVGFRLEGETLPAWEEPAAAGSARSPAWAQTPALAAGGTLA
ncbi:MAG: hypothetical protein M1281_16990, partial [Chloroflexi bacterium]|nr:hypothetical protein [Chloroflexota bacterium]